jgi:Predicted nucleic acid-binding protein, contains PIN domain
MNYLLDTCILTEFARKKPEVKVVKWLDSVKEDHLYVSVITIGELQRGVERLPESARKDTLLKWVGEGLVERLKDNILPLDTTTMMLWGSLTSWREHDGKPMGVLESLITATALRNHLTIATRYEEVYHRSGAPVVNPWNYEVGNFFS